MHPNNNKYDTHEHDTHEYDDDKPVGRILSRREVMALLGTTGMAALFTGSFRAVMADDIYLPIVQNEVGSSAATPTPTGTATATTMPTTTATAMPSVTSTPIPLCVVSPELTEGPYFVDERLNRRDIRTDPADNTVRDGTQLDLTLRVYAVKNGTCTPLSGAVVDIWHCDAAGLYSDVAAEGTAGQKFLRGYQVADGSGVVSFTTIYPGWYPGRSIHIHFKVRAELTSNPTYEFTSQFFFDEAITDVVHAVPPYAAKGRRDTLNDEDGIYQDGGSQLLLALMQTAVGYAATFDIGIAM